MHKNTDGLPARGVMTNRSHFQIHFFHAAKCALHRGQTLVGGHHLLTKVRSLAGTLVGIT